MKRIIFFVFFLLAYVFVPSAYADVSCQPIYGGGQNCVQSGNLLIDKKISNPKTNTFTDSIGINDYAFGPENTIVFQISLTNTGATRISKITTKDIFPQFMNFVSGGGNFDSNSKTLSFDVTDLNPNETKTFNITGKIVPANQLPADREVTCLVNQAVAVTNNQVSQDNVQFCVKRNIATGTTVTIEEAKGGLKVFPPQKVFTTPSTGPEMLPLIGLFPTGIFGYFLRKKAKFS